MPTWNLRSHYFKCFEILRGQSLEEEEESAQDYIDIIRKKIMELQRSNLFNDVSNKEEI